jgi:hypothetical protein
MSYQPQKRTFEYKGFVNPETSYYVPLGPVVNWNNQDMKTMVDDGCYFSIFAPILISGLMIAFKQVLTGQ